MRNRTIVGLIAALVAGSAVLVATAQGVDSRSPDWPKLKGPALFSEWYSDIPWRQKLGTFAGNQIDQALVLPYEVLGSAAQKVCSDMIDPITKQPAPLSQEQCMIEIGVTNIVGTLRTDTLYDPADAIAKGGTYCKDGEGPGTKLPCIEVKLELSLWKAEGTGQQLPARPIDLLQQPFGWEDDRDGYTQGFVVTDGSTYGPQMPWYMSHYCDSKFDQALDAQDPVCYADYLSPMNSGFNGNGAGGWPKGSAFSVYPFGVPNPPKTPNPPGNHCKEGLNTCTIALAAFDLAPVPPSLNDLQYTKYNGFLLGWFNRALNTFPTDVTPDELKRKYPWSGEAKTWESFVYPQALFNPYQGAYANTPKPDPGPGCDVTFEGTVVNGPPVAPGKCSNTGNQFAQKFLYPRQCSLNDLAGASMSDLAKVAKLRQCSLNYELHPNGFKGQWAGFEFDFDAAGMRGNQYGRTSFLFAGVRGLQVPSSFLKDATNDSGMSIYEQVYNASIFSMYLPVANVADFKNAMDSRNYTDKQFYHTLLMSNHNENDPKPFADGIRGKVLWHNEYRMQGMYEQQSRAIFRPRMFAASFDAPNAPSPYHGSTCDSCHVRNGSGIPINTEGKLDKVLQEFMTDKVYDPYVLKDYTFTGVIRPMKLVLFDLRRDTRQIDASRFSEPLAFPAAVLNTRAPRDDLYYNNKVMNFYGDSFHVTKAGYTYKWTYEDAKVDRLVVAVERTNPVLVDPKTGKNKVYSPQQIKLGTFQVPSSCDLVKPAPPRTPWPGKCSEVDGDAITAAIAGGEVGYMHLNGKRLGNLSAMEAIPNKAIVEFRDSQRTTLGPKIAGEIIWNAGSRDGVNGDVKPACKTKSLSDCYIGRFGWIGDRVSLEDQVANAAFVEMNLTTTAGYNDLKKRFPNADPKAAIRYGYPNCGPANKTCIESKGNGDLTERDVERMADYARWLGNPTRSELKVALPEVIAGEKVFRQLNCDTCHVNRKIEIVPEDTVLGKEFRERLATRVKAKSADGPRAAPFLSYIGTDLLMHDMGYLSQVAASKLPIRAPDGVVLPGYENYVQKIRTPALKGLGLNRFVTDSYKNTKTYDADPKKFKLDAACDFLLHDGRACDAIEAAFLHDGPAIKKLDTINKLNVLSAQDITNLRAFLYSL